ncbi:DUF1206 domain-containing protein [Actinopolymorpha pittospori]
MVTRTGPGRDAGRKAQQAADSGPVKLLGRVGLAAYGVVNLAFAYLAFKVATGGSGKPDKSGALQTLANQPGGQVLLWAICVGLVALVLWQLAEAAWGYSGAGSDRRRLMRRLASAGEAVVFGVLALSAGKVAAGGGGGGGSNGTQEAFTAKVLKLPLGQVLVGLVGLGVVVVAGFLVYRGLKKKFTEDLDLVRASGPGRRIALILGQVGYAALGVAYGLVGALIVVAAVTFDPQKATGLDTTLSTLARQPHGTVMLGAIAVGVACYGVYCLFDARYRKG